MKKYILCTAVICLVFSSGAQAKGCIKGALVGGAAGSMAGHGKLGAVAGCVVAATTLTRRMRKRTHKPQVRNRNRTISDAAGSLAESQGRLDRDRLVFIDETWASTNMARTHGPCQRVLDGPFRSCPNHLLQPKHALPPPTQRLVTMWVDPLQAFQRNYLLAGFDIIT